MLLSEGTIIIPRAERQKVYAYVDALKAFLTPFFAKGPQESTLILQELNSEFSPKWDNKVGKNLHFIRYEYDKNKRAGSYYNEEQTINLNLFYLGLARAGKSGILLSGVKYDELTATLMHEYAHYKQDMKVRSKQYGRMLVHVEPKNIAAYFQNPIEQHAWAVGYLEKLKAKAKVSKPEEVLASLRSVGLLHDPQIHALKNTDYDSWKAIMKHAIRTAMHDLTKK
jgi:hypothetical protein